MKYTLFGIDPRWNSLLPLLVINVLMLLTVVIFALTRKRRPTDGEFARRATSNWVGPFLYEYWGWVIRPFENLFIKLKLTPNFFTTLGFLLSVACGLSYATGHFGLAGWLMIVSGTCDIFDGRVARRTGQTTRSGAFYDSVMDRFGESAVFFGLAYFYQGSWVLYLVLAALIGSFMVSYARAKGDSSGVECKGGIMQRPERIVYLGVGSIFSPPLRQIIQSPQEAPIEYLAIIALGVIAVMTLFTAVYRMLYIFRKLAIAEGKKPKEHQSPLLKKLAHRYLDS